jgi:hypothetical protein
MCSFLGSYYERINASVFLLDPTLYNAQQTCLRNTFLFTVGQFIYPLRADI